MPDQSAAALHQDDQTKRPWLRNPLDGRLRAGWRIAAFLVLFYTIALPLVFGLRAVIGFSKSSPLVIVIIAVSATCAVYGARRWIDRKPFSSLGLALKGRSLADVVFGFILSGVMAGAIFSTMYALGYVTNVQASVLDGSAIAVLAVSLATMALVGFWEELVFRGYILQNMAEGMGMTTAVLLSCALYALVHAANPNAGVLSSSIIALFGFLRIYGYLSTSQLWLSIGMHTGWNFFQATVFGFAASGHAEEWTLLRHDAAAADWLSGGDFGPEASIVTIPVVLAALLVMRAWSRWGTYR